MDTKKHIIDLESFRDILHICPRIHGQPFAEPPFEDEILAFIRFLGHNAAIRTLTDVNINKLYHPWRSFAALINKCLTGSSGFDSLRLSQAQILRNKVNWHYVRNDFMFFMIKMVSRHQNTQQFDALLPIELMNDEIRNSKAYKEYYAIATGEAAPKPKASVMRTKSSSDTSITPPTAAASPRLKASAKGKQIAKACKAKSLSTLSEPSGSGADDGTGSKPGVPDVPTDESEEELSWNSTDDEGDDNKEKDDDGDEDDEGDDGEEGNGGDDDDDEDNDGEEGDDDADQEVVRDDDKDANEEGGDDELESDEETRKEESFDPIPQPPEDSEDEGDGEEDLSLNIIEEERHDEEEEEDELYRDVNINLGRGLQATLEVEDTHVTLTPVKPDGQQESSSVSSQFVTSMLNLTLDVGMESIFETTSRIDVRTPTSVEPLPITTPTMTSSTIATTTTTSQAPILLTTVPSDIIQHLPSFGLLFHFDDRLRSLEENFSEVMQTNQFAGAVSAIPGIVQHYMDQRMNEAVKVSVQIQSNQLCEEERENDEFLRIVDENIKKIIKEQVKEQVKAQVSKILPRIEQDVYEQLEAEVLTRSSHSSKTSYAVAADLSEMELKKILIEKIEGNKSIQRSDKQRNLYKALVDAYESDKILLDTYEETATLKRRRDDDEDKDEEPSTGPDRRSKRRREGKEPESASALSETATRSASRSTTRSRSRQASASESALVDEPMQTTSQMKEPSHPEFDTDRDWNKTLPAVYRSIQPWISELVKQVDTRSSFNELMDTPLDFSNFIMNRLRVDTLTLKLLAGPTYVLMKGSCKSLIELEYHLKEVYKATTYQLDWVNPKGQQYPHNLLQPLPLILTTEVVVLFYLRISSTPTSSIFVEGVSHWGRKRQQFYSFAVNRESARDVYSKRRIIAVTKLKIVEWHSYKHLDWITNKNKKNMLTWINELHKFSDGTLTNVRTALDDRLKGIRMRYLPKTIWRKSDKDRAAAMIQAIDKRWKTRRIMRSLERFVGGRLYEGDFRMLQRTI
uniref:Uncharacterized protein n=1 Tax=Tanacetum cinerariifolium TaxID=118510 RepID=A0A699HKJ4_TANCI|nr:hypothetical protein [Tanacetum cinerariifolium]